MHVGCKHICKQHSANKGFDLIMLFMKKIVDNIHVCKLCPMILKKYYIKRYLGWITCNIDKPYSEYHKYSLKSTSDWGGNLSELLIVTDLAFEIACKCQQFFLYSVTQDAFKSLITINQRKKAFFCHK